MFASIGYRGSSILQVHRHELRHLFMTACWAGGTNGTSREHTLHRAGGRYKESTLHLMVTLRLPVLHAVMFSLFTSNLLTKNGGNDDEGQDSS